MALFNQTRDLMRRPGGLMAEPMFGANMPPDLSSYQQAVDVSGAAPAATMSAIATPATASTTGQGGVGPGMINTSAQPALRKGGLFGPLYGMRVPGMR